MKSNDLPFWVYLTFLVLLLPALLINLGLMTFIDDEGIRTLVAQEMDLSGNWITPTLHGEFYYKKPPLFNWILLVWFNIVGKVTEFTARIPTVAALIGYGATVYWYFRRAYAPSFAFMQVVALLTCGRILFWDSLLALIDVTFSWVVFTQFMVTYFAFAKKRWLNLFVLTYLLTAIAFLLKGLPAIVFQGITLLAYFSFRGAFRHLFRWEHLVGGLVFVILVGGYYGMYHQYNDLSNVFPTLFSESSQRTVVYYGAWDTLLHIFTFPLEMTYHFLPWSVLILYVLQRGVWKKIKTDAFMSFNTVVFLANVVIYWVSPEVYPRYLLMFIPLVFSVLFYLHGMHQKKNTWQFRMVMGFFALLVIVLGLAWWIPPFLSRLDVVPHRYLKSFGLAFLAVGLVWLYFRKNSYRLAIAGVLLLVFRIGFDFFVLTDRNAHDYGDVCRQSSIEAGRAFKDRPMYVYGFDTEMQMTNSTYLTKERQSIIPVVTVPTDESNAVYIIDPSSYPDLKYAVLDSVFLRHGKRTFYIGSFY